jgi:hypothetical protein
VRSEVDRALISLAGNALTDFRFHVARIQLACDATTVRLRVNDQPGRPNPEMIATAAGKEPLLPADSCFNSVAEAEAILKYQPVALATSADGSLLRLAEVLRDESRWNESPLHVARAGWRYLEDLGQRDLALERATRAAPLEYRWRIGRTQPLAATAASPRELPEDPCRP